MAKLRPDMIAWFREQATVPAPTQQPRERMSFTDIPRDLIIKCVLDWVESQGYNINGLILKDKDPSKSYNRGATSKTYTGKYARLYEPDDKPRRPSSYLNIYFDGGIPTATIYRNKGGDVLKWTPAMDTRLQGRNVPYKDEYFTSLSGTNTQTVAPISATRSAPQPDINTEAVRQAAYTTMCDIYRAGRALVAYDTSSGARYLQRKHVFKAALQYDPTLRISTINDKSLDALLVPFWTFAPPKDLITMQKIRHNWDVKPWQKDRPTPDGLAWHLIRRHSEAVGKLILCEGLATGLSVYLHYRAMHDVAVCGNCTSLTKTGLKLLELYPNLTIYIAADNDAANVAKHGHNNGIEAAEAVRAAAPERVFITCPPSTDGNSIDFNDYYGGLD